MTQYKQLRVDIRVDNLNDGKFLYPVAMTLYNTKYEKEGISMIIDFEHGLVNFANEKSCKINNEMDIFSFLENIGYEILSYSMVPGKVLVY